MSRKSKFKKVRRDVRSVIQASNVPASLRTLAIASEGFEIRAAADGEKKGPRKFGMTAYTGASMNVAGFYRPVVIDLTGLKVPTQRVAILKDHDAGQIVGHTESIEVSPQRIKLEGAVSGVGESAQEVMGTADNGFPWQASVGASVEKAEYVEAGATATVNGRKFTGPITIVRAATLREISFVALGADPATSAKVAAEAAEQEKAMDPFEKWLAAKFDGVTFTDEQKTDLKAKFDAEQKALKAAADPKDDDDGDDDETDAAAELKAARKAQADESRRVAGIIKACKGTHGEIEAKAIEEGWDVTKTEKEVELVDLRAGRPKASPPAGGGSSDQSHEVIEASLCLSAGIATEWLGKRFGEKTMNVAMEKKNRDMTIVSAMYAVILAAGKHVVPGKVNNDFIRAAFEASRELKASGFSSLTLPGILGNVASKIMLAAYEAAAVTWPAFCAVRSHSDFKTSTRYRLDSTGAFKKMGNTGEIKHVGLTEGSYANRLETYAAMIALDRQTIINDDLEAFSQIPRLFGRMSTVRLEEAVYVLLLSNPSSFFHANNSNLLTGAGSALAIAGLTDGEASFMNRVDSQGKPILLSGKILLVPTTLKVTADNLMVETTLAVTTTANVPILNRNPHAGKFTVTSSPYLNNTAIRDQDGIAITGQSSTAWYVFADPNDRAAIAVAFLNGQRNPTIESDEMDFNNLGMQWRAYHDFGVGMEDPVAAVKNAGT